MLLAAMVEVFGPLRQATLGAPHPKVPVHGRRRRQRGVAPSRGLSEGASAGGDAPVRGRREGEGMMLMT